MDELSRWLKIMRVKEEMTLSVFAEKMGYNSSSYACGIESGRIKPSNDFVDKILGIFPKYEKHRDYLDNLLKQRIESMKTRHKISIEFLDFSKRINNLSSGEQRYIFGEIDSLIKKRE